MPIEFATYINYCRGLKFAEEPDYAYLRRLFHNLFVNKGYTNDCRFDWTLVDDQNHKIGLKKKHDIREQNACVCFRFY